MDLYWPFSESRNVNKWLKQDGIKNEHVSILNPTLRPSISAYSGEKYFGIETVGSLFNCLWDVHMPDSVLKSKLNSALNSDSIALIITNIPFNHLIDSTKTIKLKSFQDGILPGENADVYKVRK